MEDEIPYMHPIRPYENDSLCEMDSGGEGQKYFQTKKKGDISNKIVS